MIDEGRYVIIGVSMTRARWFAEVGSWASGGAAPIEFIRCVSVAEALGRLRSGARVSAVLVDSTTPGADRDLSAHCDRHGVALLHVAGARTATHHLPHGAPVLRSDFGVDELVSTLASVARPIRWRTVTNAAELAEDAGAREPDATAFRGRLTVVCGRSGAGASVSAMALAQRLAADDVGAGNVLLADLALNGDLACYHDALDVVPGLQEFVEAHRHGTASRSAVESMVAHVPDRGYSLLPGLRRTHDWVALTPAAIEATLDSLRSSFRHVVADVTADVEGEALSGSVDVEERNALARLSLEAADLVVAVGRSGLKGIRDLVRLLDDLDRHGVDADRILPIVVDAPRDRPSRVEITATVADLCRSAPTASVVFVPRQRRLDALLRCADPLPTALCNPIGQAVLALGRHLEDAEVAA
jgi:hypothetical protein